MYMHARYIDIYEDIHHRDMMYMKETPRQYTHTREMIYSMHIHHRDIYMIYSMHIHHDDI